MAEGTKIQWTDDTHNFWQGCTKVSPGCANCYAEARDKRFTGGIHWGPGAPRQRSKSFDAPLRWNLRPHTCDKCGESFTAQILKPNDGHTFKDSDGVVKHCTNNTFHRRRVFSLSLGDWLDPEVPIEWLADMLDVLRRCPNLDFLLLTKRPELWRERIHEAMKTTTNHPESLKLWNWLDQWHRNVEAPSNVWIGTTVEDQKRADERIPALLKIPAKIRFLSVEPLLEAVDISFGLSWEKSDIYSPVTGEHGIDWVIIGGESGPGARPFNIEWARSIIAHCRAAGVACFVKQLGAKPYFKLSPPNAGKIDLPLEDKKGGDISEFPEDLRIRQFPTVEARPC